MHQPDSERKIETIIDGEPVHGTVRHSGVTDIAVRLDQPSDERWTELHMPYFARPVHPEGFLGEYGDQRALELLTGLYREQKQGDRRRKFAASDFEEFGRVRYIAVSPGHPAQELRIREQAKVTSTIHVQLEDDGPYGLARFFDSGTNQPFLAEKAVYDQSIETYVAGVTADVGFSQHLQAVRERLLPAMTESADRFKNYNLNPQQVRFLVEFGQAWRTGDPSLEAEDVDQLIALGYLVRDPSLNVNERATLEVSLNHSRQALARLEAAGRHNQAAECRAKIEKRERRSEIKKLMITAAGKAVAKLFPADESE